MRLEVDRFLILSVPSRDSAGFPAWKRERKGMDRPPERHSHKPDRSGEAAPVPDRSGAPHP